jgi:hypothetical protein
MGVLQPDTPLSQALALMRWALELLDLAQAPPDVGAHLDLAISRLEEAIEGGGGLSNEPGSIHQSS